MSREIKFRGKRLDSGEWVYGSLFNGERKKLILKVAPVKPERENIYPICGFEVIPESVGQYTGFKDTHGTEIYEGDHVRCYGGQYCQGFWEYDKTIEVKDMTYDCFELAHFEFLEVAQC